MVLEKTLESPLDSKEIQPVHLKGNLSWIFIEKIDVEAEIPILCPPDVKNWLIWKVPVAGKDWRQEKGTTEDEMVWMSSPTQWTWVWVDSRSWQWTGRPGVLRSMGSQRVEHWVTGLNWTEQKIINGELESLKRKKKKKKHKTLLLCTTYVSSGLVSSVQGKSKTSVLFFKVPWV